MATVYADSTSTRFYLVPDGTDLPPGPLVLRSLTGDRVSVDAEAAEPFEIPEDEAKAHVKEQLAEVARRATGMLSGLGAVLQDVAAGRGRPEPRPTEAHAADALGVTPEELREDPEAVIAGLRRLGAGLVESLRDALSGEGASEEVTRERIVALAQAVGADPESLVDLRAKLKTALLDPELEARVRQATDSLRTVADDLQRSVDGEE